MKNILTPFLIYIFEKISCVINKIQLPAMNPTGFSISEYHDIKPIYEKLNKLVSLPLSKIAPAQLKNI